MNGHFYADVDMLTGMDNIFQYYLSVGILNPWISVLYVELQFVQLIGIFPICYAVRKFIITFAWGREYTLVHTLITFNLLYIILKYSPGYAIICQVVFFKIFWGETATHSKYWKYFSTVLTLVIFGNRNK
jgi:hypothetical protein